MIGVFISHRLTDLAVRFIKGKLVLLDFDYLLLSPDPLGRWLHVVQ